MAQVLHTVKWTYGSYSGETNVLVAVDADMATIEGKVRRIESLNFLAMASTSFKIVKSVRELSNNPNDEDYSPEYF